jgi:hypothetical protein
MPNPLVPNPRSQDPDQQLTGHHSATHRAGSVLRVLRHGPVG